jgi:hypothetical protein
MTKPRVFFVQKSYRRVGADWELTVDPQPAMAYGDVRYLLDHADVDDLSLREVFAKLADGLKDFSKDDYLVLVGNATAMMMAGIIACDLTGGCVQIVQWERTTTKYVEFTLDLDVLLPHVA